MAGETIKLTARSIGTLKLAAGQKDRIAYDSEIPGFGLRLREGGSRNFVFSYRFGGANKRMVLGTASPDAFGTVKDKKTGAVLKLCIRERVIQMQAQVKLGHDPAVERDTNRAQAANTFKTTAERFLAVHQKEVRPATYNGLARYLLVTAKALHGKPIATIDRKDIAGVLSEAQANVSKGTGAATANRLKAAIGSLFSWAMMEGIVESNPTIGTYQRPEVPRSRTLVDGETGDMSELVAVWHALDDSPFSDIARLLILTGQRRTEIGGLKWSEVDKGLTRIRLPPERQKNHGGKKRLPHLIPLSDAAREIIARQHQVIGRDAVFAERGNVGFTGWDAHTKALRAKLPGLAPWTLHDLRRSVSTGLSKLGVQPHVKEAVLNHTKGGVEGTYDQSTYLPEKAAALQMWAEHLLAAVEGKTAKVVPLRA